MYFCFMVFFLEWIIPKINDNKKIMAAEWTLQRVTSPVMFCSPHCWLRSSNHVIVQPFTGGKYRYSVELLENVNKSHPTSSEDVENIYTWFKLTRQPVTYGDSDTEKVQHVAKERSMSYRYSVDQFIMETTTFLLLIWARILQKSNLGSNTPGNLLCTGTVIPRRSDAPPATHRDVWLRRGT